MILVPEGVLDGYMDVSGLNPYVVPRFARLELGLASARYSIAYTAGNTSTIANAAAMKSPPMGLVNSVERSARPMKSRYGHM